MAVFDWLRRFQNINKYIMIRYSLKISVCYFKADGAVLLQTTVKKTSKIESVNQTAIDTDPLSQAFFPTLV